MKSTFKHIIPALAISALAAITLAGAAHASQNKSGTSMPDPLATGVWHAELPSWPGTLTFDSKTKIVVLAPVGAAPITASYTYSIDSAKSKDGRVEGAMKMTLKSMDGVQVGSAQTSDTKFSIANGKQLTLTFNNGQPPEVYRHMTPAEEAAEVKKMKQMLEDGTLKNPFKQ